MTRQPRFLIVATACFALSGCLAAEMGEDEVVCPVAELDRTYFLLADDILLDRENPEQLQWAESVLALHAQGETEEGVRQTTGVRKLKTKLWPNNTFTYHFASNVPAADRPLFRAAARKYADVSDLKFVESPKSGSYIYTIEKVSSYKHGGLSTLGYTKNAHMQYIDPYYFLHELGHGIGLHHEQQRPDRDNFIQVNWANIPSHLKVSFTKLEAVA
jgi:hypothetical protein